MAVGPKKTTDLWFDIDNEIPYANGNLPKKPGLTFDQVSNPKPFPLSSDERLAVDLLGRQARFDDDEKSDIFLMMLEQKRVAQIARNTECSFYFPRGTACFCRALELIAEEVRSFRILCNFAVPSRAWAAILVGKVQPSREVLHLAIDSWRVVRNEFFADGLLRKERFRLLIEGLTYDEWAICWDILDQQDVVRPRYGKRKWEPFAIHFAEFKEEPYAVQNFDRLRPRIGGWRNRQRPQKKGGKELFYGEFPVRVAKLIVAYPVLPKYSEENQARRKKILLDDVLRDFLGIYRNRSVGEFIKANPDFAQCKLADLARRAKIPLETLYREVFGVRRNVSVRELIESNTDRAQYTLRDLALETKTPLNRLLREFLALRRLESISAVDGDYQKEIRPILRPTFNDYSPESTCAGCGATNVPLASRLFGVFEMETFPQTRLGFDEYLCQKCFDRFARDNFISQVKAVSHPQDTTD